jgi:membrane dipeptidase
VVEPSSEASERIERIHQKFAFVDMHSHPSRFHRANIPRITREEIDRYRRARMDVVVCNISTDAIYRGHYVERDGTRIEERTHPPDKGEPLSFTLDRLTRILKTVEDGDAVLASSPQSVDAARKDGQLALLPGLEGGDGLEGSIENLRQLHHRGLRLLQFVHFRVNELGHVQTHPYTRGGLTPFGRQAVQECNRLGILIDLAHANTETIMDTLEASSRPVLFSHTGAKALHDGDRYLTDREIRSIAARGGVIGIWPNGSDLPHMKDMMRHLHHVKELVGSDHVGIASDWRGLSSYTEEFGEDADFTLIARAMLDLEYSDDEVGKIMGGNFLRVWREVEDGRNAAPGA